MVPTFSGSVAGNNSTTISISILYGPRVIPMQQRDTVVGTRLEQTCSYVSGNPAQTFFKWTLTTNTGTWLVQTNQTLVIASVQRSDDSNYTCQVSNVLIPTVGASVNRTDEGMFHLNVLFPSENLVMSVDAFPGLKSVTVNESDVHALHCKLESNPGSTIAITKDGVNVSHALNTKILNYTLSSNCEAAGVYTCSGSNEYGSAPADSIQYFVNCSPRRASGEVARNVSSKQHDTATMKLAIQGYPSPTHRWEKCLNETCNEIPSTSKYIVSSDGLGANLTVVNVEQSDFGQYKFTALNGVGSLTEIFWLIPSDKPDIPKNFSYVPSSVTQTSVTLSWIPGFNGGPPQTFHIEYKKSSDSFWIVQSVPETSENPTQMNMTLDNLSPATQYEARIKASNTIGSSNYTEISTLLTLKVLVTTSSSNIGAIAGGIVGGVVGILVIALVVIGFRRYELTCIRSCVRKQESTGHDLYETSAMAVNTNGEYDSLGNSNEIRHNEHDQNNDGYDNDLNSKAYDNLDAGQSGKYIYSELGRPTVKDNSRLYDNTAVHLDAGKAVYVNTTFGMS